MNTLPSLHEAEPMQYEIHPRLSLSVYPTDRFKTGLLAVHALLPDTAEISPVAATLLPVLRRGTACYPDQEQINRYLDDLYATDCHASNTAIGDARCIGFLSEMIERRVLPDGTDLLPDVMELITQLFFAPAVEADGMPISRYVEQEQKKLIDAIASLINHPPSYAMYRFRTLFARDKESGAPVSVAQLERTDRQSLATLLQTLQDKACFHVFYIGQTDARELIALLQKHLLPHLHRMPPVPLPAFSPRCYAAAGQPLYVNETADAAQSHLILGYRTDITLISPHFHAMMLCNELLGGSPVSRLFRHLREEKSLCYSCQSEYYHTRGELIVSCGIDREKRQESEDAICEQLRALQTGNFTDQELEDARRLLVNSYIQLTDSTRAIHAYYHTRLLLGVKETVDRCRAHCLAVTREDVILAARSLKMDTVYFLEGTADGEEDDTEEDEADA